MSANGTGASCRARCGDNGQQPGDKNDGILVFVVVVVRINRCERRTANCEQMVFLPNRIEPPAHMARSTRDHRCAIGE